MSKNLVINGVTYNGIESMEIPTTEGEKVVFVPEDEAGVDMPKSMEITLDAEIDRFKGTDSVARVHAKTTEAVLLGEGAEVNLHFDKSVFGDASFFDVNIGSTFTSKFGMRLAGQRIPPVLSDLLPEITVHATAENIVSGKEAIDADGNVLVGTMPNNGAVNANLSLGGSYTIPEGYHDGTGVVQGAALPELTTPGGAEHLREGYQMIDENGNAVDGALPDVTPTVSIEVEGGLIAATATIPKEGVVAEGGTKETLQLPTPEAATPSLELNVDEATVVATVSQEPGYIEEASTKTATLDLPAYYGAYITPGTVNQEAGGRGQFMMSPVVVRGDEYLVPENIAAGVSIFGVVGAHEGGVTLPTLENPATEAEVFEGYEFINGTGEKKTGSFTVEEEVAELEELAAALKGSLAGKIATGGGSGQPDPSALYQRVEYIASDGAAYAVTDFIADNTCGVEMIVSFPHFADHVWIGSREDSGSTRFFAPYAYSASIWYAGFNGNVKISASTKVDSVYRCQANFLNTRLTTVHDEAGALKGSAAISDTLAAQTYPICICTLNYGGTPRTPRIFNLYSARCSKGHEVVREYIPCYRKSDGVIGLYEKFTGSFLTNAGTGAFAKGADVAWDFNITGG